MYTLEKVWPEWKIIKEIGRGSYGVVYKCVKEEKNNKLYSAVKLVELCNVFLNVCKRYAE